MFAGWRTGAGWGGGRRQPGDRDLSGAGPATSLWLPLPLSLLSRPQQPRLFISTALGVGGWGGSTARGQEGARDSAPCLPSPAAGQQAEGLEALRARKPYLPVLQTTPALSRAHRHALLLSGLHAQTSWDISLLRLSRGTLANRGHIRSHTHVHRRLLLLQHTSSSALMNMHTLVHTVVAAWTSPGDLGHTCVHMCSHSNVARHSGKQLPHFRSDLAKSRHTGSIPQLQGRPDHFRSGVGGISLAHPKRNL